MNNRTCIGFSGVKSNLTEAKRICTAVEGGKLFNGDSLNATQLYESATVFLKSQNKTVREWIWIDAYYKISTNRVLGSSSGQYIYK